MPIQPISSAATLSKKHFIPKVTGYGALAVGVASGIAAVNKKHKLHKNLAYLTGILTLLHAGIIEFFHYKNSKKV